MAARKKTTGKKSVQRVSKSLAAAAAIEVPSIEDIAPKKQDEPFEASSRYSALGAGSSNQTRVVLDPVRGFFGAGVSPICGGMTTAVLIKGRNNWNNPTSRKPTIEYGDDEFWGFGTSINRKEGVLIWDKNMQQVRNTAYWDEDGNWKYTGDNLVVYAHWLWPHSQVMLWPTGGTFTALGKREDESVLLWTNLDGTAYNNAPSYKPTWGGHTFQGFYTEKNGGGIKVWNADMTAAKGTVYWNSDTSPKWIWESAYVDVYAKWMSATQR